MLNYLKESGQKPGFKALLIGLLVLGLFIPMSFVSELVRERQMRADQARFDVGYAWGGRSQTIAGPFLVIPYQVTRELTRGLETTQTVEKRFAVYLPESLNISADVASETRYRGIYDVATYAATLKVNGHFDRPDETLFVQEGVDVDWDGAFVALSLTDNRGIKNAVTLKWGARGENIAFEPGQKIQIFDLNGVHAPLSQAGIGDDNRFEISLKLNGSDDLQFVPVGRDTQVRVGSDWPDPSFKGGFLPSEREISSEGFEATWEIPQLARSFPQMWTQNPQATVITPNRTVARDRMIEPAMEPSFASASSNPYMDELSRSSFWITFQPAVDLYQRIERSTKYAILFFGFTFLTFFLYETLLPARIHAVQYLMIGASQCIFYLLLLSLSEHIGFMPAYLIASAANIGLIAIYTDVVLGNRMFAVAIGAVLLVIYALLFSLLQVADFALLFGSIASFLALAVTMFMTRNIDWHGSREAEPAQT